MPFQEKITALSNLYQASRDEMDDNFRLRIHRSLSWIKKSSEFKDDLDMRFITLWIAFNAAYARELELENREYSTLTEFLDRICSHDEQHHIYNLIWRQFSGAIRLLLDNQFIFSSFWEYHNGKIDEKQYIKKEMIERERGLSALENKNTTRLLSTIFNRLYVLRNQIIHGGATYNSKVNREQLKDGCNILSMLLPAMLEIMIKNHDQRDWGIPFYPVVNR